MGPPYRLPWVQALTLALAAFFVVGFVINTFMVKLVGSEYQRWGYPGWFHFVSGGLELFVALLLPAMATRLFGVALGAGGDRHRCVASRISPRRSAARRVHPARDRRRDGDLGSIRRGEGRTALFDPWNE